MFLCCKTEFHLVTWWKKAHGHPNSEEVSRTFDDGKQEKVEKSAAGHIADIQHQLKIKIFRLIESADSLLFFESRQLGPSHTAVPGFKSRHPELERHF